MFRMRVKRSHENRSRIQTTGVVRLVKVLCSFPNKTVISLVFSTGNYTMSFLRKYIERGSPMLHKSPFDFDCLSCVFAVSEGESLAGQ